MKLQLHKFSSGRVRSRGFTLVELMVSIALGVVVIGAVFTLAIFSAQNFVATANYASIDMQSRYAMDRVSREIRNATALVGYSPKSPQFLLLTNANNASMATISYDAGASTLTLAKSGQPDQTLLTGCDSFSFQLFDRIPVITATNISFGASTNPSTGVVDPRYCKIINFKWSCSRTIFGSKLNTEVSQGAQVMLRNQAP
jgi:prepilin-type N-terminal cleavage/methylation domain-containing protein